MRFEIKPLLTRVVGVFGIFALAMFVPVLPVGWIAAWIFLGLFSGPALELFVWPYGHNPGLLRERMPMAC